MIKFSRRWGWFEIGWRHFNLLGMKLHWNNQWIWVKTAVFFPLLFNIDREKNIASSGNRTHQSDADYPDQGSDHWAIETHTWQCDFSIGGSQERKENRRFHPHPSLSHSFLFEICLWRHTHTDKKIRSLINFLKVHENATYSKPFFLRLWTPNNPFKNLFSTAIIGFMNSNNPSFEGWLQSLSKQDTL